VRGPDTARRTEAELFGWSFVLDYLASEAVIKQVLALRGRQRERSCVTRAIVCDRWTVLKATGA
jgi:hypothetical protein